MQVCISGSSVFSVAARDYLKGSWSTLWRDETDGGRWVPAIGIFWRCPPSSHLPWPVEHRLMTVQSICPLHYAGGIVSHFRQLLDSTVTRGSESGTTALADPSPRSCCWRLICCIGLGPLLVGMLSDGFSALQMILSAMPPSIGVSLSVVGGIAYLSSSTKYARAIAQSEEGPDT